MKREMELIRELLLEIEATPAQSLYATSETSITRCDREVLDEHFALLDDAGFVTGFDQTRSECSCNGLTWKGHDFLDAARPPSVWSAVRKKLRETGMSVPFDVLTSLLAATAKEQLGIKG